MDKTKYSWAYHVTWYTNGHQQIVVDDVCERIRELFPRLCTEAKVKLTKMESISTAVMFSIGSDEQINISKILMSLQKKLSKILLKEFSLGEELWDPKHLVVTDTSEVCEGDIRIQKILKGVAEVGYYDLYEAFDDELSPFKQYLGQRKLATVEWGDRMFLVDKAALQHEINLNCFECTKIYKYGCCCGSPCDYGSRNRKVFEQHAEAIGEMFKALDEPQYGEIMEKGGFVNSEGEISEANGRCGLLAQDEGVWKCMAHKYGLDHEISIYEICPLSCLMYPLEILELISDKQKKVMLITSVLEDDFAKAYGRWGSYESLDVDLRCLNKKAHDGMFEKQGYKPVYQVNKGLLTHEFGAYVYSGITQVMNEVE